VIDIVIFILYNLATLLILLVIVHVILSYVMDRYHPVRRWVDSIVEPMLMPIRRVMPLVGTLDFSPLILIILIRILSNLIIRLLR
jgi:YggT family protein